MLGGQVMVSTQHVRIDDHRGIRLSYCGSLVNSPSVYIQYPFAAVINPSTTS